MEAIYKFARNPAMAGIVLFLMTVLALVLSNSMFKQEYLGFIHHKITLGIAGFSLNKPMDIWVNEGLMAIFFFHVGLEIKHEFTAGTLTDKSKLMVPGVAAIGGMFMPALIYIFATGMTYLSGWAIPTATDIAFSLAICGLLGSRVPLIFRVLLLSIAIFDDIGAVFIIALFYTTSLSLVSLVISLILVTMLAALKHNNVQKLLPYFIIGPLLWLAVVKSGVHATLAGFILALFLPNSNTEKLEHMIQPWVAMIVMPFFALVNAGVDFSTVSSADIAHPVTKGIFFGLVFGKPIGVYLAFKLMRFKELPTKAIIALGALCGVGFTMSLFIGTLAFGLDISAMNWVKLGVILASLSMGFLGYFLLRNTYK